jgi:hypothetical protein
MPKKDVDYSNTIIYKICCKDESITDVYVGHTTNFVQRKYLHKHSCNNLDYTLKIYNVIRSNGGWDNWDMVEIAKYNCKDASEARIKEQQHYNELKASLNSCPPCVDMKTYFCDICDLQCKYPNQYNRHINSDKHKNLSSIKFDDNLGAKRAKKGQSKYVCELCDFVCSKKYSWERHILTSKHLEVTESEQMVTEKGQKGQKNCCENCGKEYLSRNGLWKHKKVCKFDETIVSNTTSNDKNSEIKFDKELFMMLINQNKELLEIVKNGTPL